MTDTALRYVEAGRLAAVPNAIVRWLAEHGVSLFGTRVLYVRGRKSGRRRSTVVNLLTMDGERYLVCPRGNSQWVRNLRAAEGRGELGLGRRVEPFAAVEIPDADKPAILRAYLKRWKWQVAALFEGVGPDSSDEELLRVAPGYPVFRLT
ncbi:MULTISPECIES: nitroreductase/quinone reductase family protein [Thermomonospora]|uniref:Nitroreductase n=1 Tax=Thermomonospora curvata (strain ATCC 19995 / DSM 43183 / JCM 3096 / KCTC 9072 / NBRC 15933 / NCIMB 10081 / Henssen B9) TaxID=471852 RepID=D1AE60_THECD|nr:MULTISPECIES: nitroreductase/quinone reductase family protein [Thermomonospora]ACY99486.1 hypothetical protein Tcur_3957 [Thermomonospora curvata DSM 43183]PKK12531.1 MAG: DUF385 domain-containing protein [Thermomonospora sp. CIF 1]